MSRNKFTHKRKFTFPKTKQQFLANLVPTGNCLVYPGGNKYPTVTGVLRGERFSNRVAWILANGYIPEGMSVLHKCNITNCCNLEHLYLGDRH